MDLALSQSVVDIEENFFASEKPRRLRKGHPSLVPDPYCYLLFYLPTLRVKPSDRAIPRTGSENLSRQQSA